MFLVTQFAHKCCFIFVAATLVGGQVRQVAATYLTDSTAGHRSLIRLRIVFKYEGLTLYRIQSSTSRCSCRSPHGVALNTCNIYCNKNLFV